MCLFMQYYTLNWVVFCAVTLSGFVLSSSYPAHQQCNHLSWEYLHWDRIPGNPCTVWESHNKAIKEKMLTKLCLCWLSLRKSGDLWIVMMKQNYAGFIIVALTQYVRKWELASENVTVTWWRHSMPCILCKTPSWISARSSPCLTSPRHLLWILNSRWPTTSLWHKWKSLLHQMGRSRQWNSWLML